MLDLHGFTIHKAWEKFTTEVDDAYHSGKKSIIVITGRGQMAAELGHWVSNHPKAVFCEEMHAGCFRVKLRRKNVTS